MNPASILYNNPPKDAQHQVESPLGREVVNNPLSCPNGFTSSCCSLFYYPLYGGWKLPKMPYLFGTQGEACTWALSRFKRDGPSNICGPNYPEFLKFVGTIVTDLNSIQDCTLTMPFRSKIERLFFQGVTFYQLKKNTEYKTHYQRIDGTNFSMLTTLFHPKIDIQMSALSTYKPSVTCHTFPITSSFYLRNDQITRKHKISSYKIIRFEEVCRPMRDHSFGDFEMVSKFLEQFLPPIQVQEDCCVAMCWQGRNGTTF
jgi:hypothetical protein